ncbi:hypothetical protein [Streptomyces nymphaeiformis]|uniref:Uncharacterized protein n=1 Tax=Streptomyces nymphaeiformis TaxID=2663842 RepID=A0A7W7XEC2_9ACTN|nr:hypothetical protein [Streptomyces nymphaeiformis]MBB4984977.1 hypothetical protein [Streptomyces nymphaeiformis]
MAKQQTTGTYATGVCTYGVTQARGSGCIKPAGHDSAHLVTEGDVDDEYCGAEYDAFACELEPGHLGAHLDGTFGWAYEPEAAPTSAV